jgi:hypothetical protein
MHVNVHSGTDTHATLASCHHRLELAMRLAAASASTAANITSVIVWCHRAQQLVQPLGSALHLWVVLVVSHCAGGGRCRLRVRKRRRCCSCVRYRSPAG